MDVKVYQKKEKMIREASTKFKHGTKLYIAVGAHGWEDLVKEMTACGLVAGAIMKPYHAQGVRRLLKRHAESPVSC